jgi:hypothetical protein
MDNIDQTTINNILNYIIKYPDEETINFLTSRPWWRPFHVEINNYLQQYFPLTHIVASPDNDHFYKYFISQSKFYLANNVELIKMKQSSCHENCEKLFMEGKIDSCVFGYALSNDGLFRVHSWGLKDGKIIETTEKRLLYFGYAF